MTRYALWLAALAGLLLVCRVDAQVNIEKMRQEGLEPGLGGAVGLDLKARSGNVDVWELGLGGQLGLIWPRGISLLIARGELGWKDGERYSNEGLLHLRHEWRGERRARPEFFAQIDYDKARLLDFRSLVGGGLRTRLYRRESLQAWWGTSYMLEHERLEADGALAVNRTVTVHRWSNYLNLRARFDERTRILLTVYAQPRFEAWNDLRVLADVRLTAGLGGPFSLTVSGNGRYDSRPPANIEDLDIKLRTGVEAAF